MLNTHRVHHDTSAEFTEMNYGILKPIHSTNPFYVGFHLWADIWRELNVSLPSSVTKLKLFFAPPGWADEYRAKQP